MRKPVRCITTYQLLEANRLGHLDGDRRTLPEDLVHFLETTDQDWSIQSLDYTTAGHWGRVTVSIERQTYPIELPPQIEKGLGAR